MPKVLIDTDPGEDIDDLLAIWFALLRPELDIRAITTVTYPSAQRARLIKRLLRYLNKPDIPVAAGMQYPLRPFSAQDIARQNDLPKRMNHACFFEPLDDRDTPSKQDAVDLIIEIVHAYPNDITLLCIAPLTNIATALRRDPTIASKISRIILMGGETAQLRVEHNIVFDYLAADVVFSAGIPLVMGTWSVTRQFSFTAAEVEQIRAHGPLGQAMAAAIDAWQPAQPWKPAPVMYDLFPMIHAFDESLYATAPMHIEIETQGTHTRGMTVAKPGEPNAQVTTEISVPAVREMYFRTIFS
jgi:purine nucleosidase